MTTMHYSRQWFDTLCRISLTILESVGLQGGRAAQTINTLNDTEADWTGSVQKSAMYVRAQSADTRESVRILSAVAYSIGEIWVTQEEVLATPPPLRATSFV